MNGDVTQPRLLQSIVEVGRHAFSAAACSVFLVDKMTDELVFAAVSGEGEQHLVGQRFPLGTGIAGWVASCGQPLLADEVDRIPQFSQDAAESTGFVPQSIMAAPLLLDGECTGVLEVLDRGSDARGELADVDLLGLLATQAAMAISLMETARLAGEDERSATALRLLSAAEDLLSGRS